MLLGLLFLFTVLFFAGCNEVDSSSLDNSKVVEDKYVFVATFYPVQEITEAIVLDSADVSVLVPLGVDPHSYEPTPTHIVSLSKADVFIAMGGIFEHIEEDVIEANPNVKVIDATHTLELVGEEENHNELSSKISVCRSLSDSEKENCYVSLCEESTVNMCAENIISNAVSDSGSEFALEVLTDLSKTSGFASIDIYYFGQGIGRLTMENYGSSGDDFSLCSKDFHYSCYYGFFEAVMSDEGLTPLETAKAICGSLSNSEGNTCYHKMGHMFMKYGSHEFDPTLSLCDSLVSEFQSHCWDGVFMEGVNEELLGNFLSSDVNVTSVLAPCNMIDEQYKEMCYKNHGPYMLEYFKDSSEALASCNRAGKYAEVCRHSVMDASSGAEHHHVHDEGVDEQENREDEHQEDENGHGNGHDDGEYDPHVWLLINNMKEMTREVEVHLSEMYPQNAQFYSENAEMYLKRLEELEEEFDLGLSNCNNDKIIVNHKAFGYLANEYGFEQISVTGFSPQSEPTPKTIQRVIDVARENNLKYIFSEGQLDSKTTQTIANDIGAEVLELNPLEMTENEDYFSVMRGNLNNLRIGLDCH